MTRFAAGLLASACAVATLAATPPQDPATQAYRGAANLVSVYTTVTDESGLTATATTRAVLANVAPTGTFATGVADGHVAVGTPVTLSFADVTDPSTADVTAGITRAYSCTAAGENFTASPTCETPALCSALAALISPMMSVTRLIELTTSVIVTPA